MAKRADTLVSPPGTFTGGIEMQLTRDTTTYLACALVATALLCGPASAWAGPGVLLGVSPQTLTFDTTAGLNPLPQTVVVANEGKGSLKWRVTTTADWVSVSPATGVNAGTVSISVDAATLPPGMYAATVRVTDHNGKFIDVPASLSVFAPPAEQVPGPGPTPEPTPEPTPSPSTAVIDVPLGGDLQAALDAARPGTLIRLAAGGTYAGPFKLRPNAGDYITITTNGDLPAAGSRITPEFAGRLARLQSATAEPAIRTTPGANRYRLVGLEFGQNAGAYSEIIRLGDATDPTEANIPYDFTIDRVLILVDPLVGQKRGIAANADNVTIINSDIRGVWGAYGEDSQAVIQWQAHGNLVIRNNRLEAGSEVVMIGGAYPAVAGLNPVNILIEGNHITRPLEWMAAAKYKVKNLFELKAGRHVVVRGNRLDNHWAAAQAGPAIVFTPKHGMRVTDVLFENNVVRNVGTGFNMYGYDYQHPYDRSIGPQLERVTIRNNLFVFNRERFGGNGRFILTGEGADNITVERNTVVSEGATLPNAAIYGYGTQGVSAWTIRDNIMFHGTYGVFSDQASYGNATLSVWFHNPVFEGNVLNDARASLYPAGNAYPSWLTLSSEFVDSAKSDYRLRDGSLFQGRGVDFSTLPDLGGPPQ